MSHSVPIYIPPYTSASHRPLEKVLARTISAAVALQQDNKQQDKSASSPDAQTRKVLAGTANFHYNKINSTLFCRTEFCCAEQRTFLQWKRSNIRAHLVF